MDSFGIRWGRVFPWVQDSGGYLLFSTNSNPDPNIVIVISALPSTRPAAFPLPLRRPIRPRGGVGCGGGCGVCRHCCRPRTQSGHRQLPPGGGGIPACESLTRNTSFSRTLPHPPFRGNDDCLPRCPTTPAGREEEEEEEEEK